MKVKLKVLDLYLSWLDYGLSLGYTELQARRILENQPLNIPAITSEDRWPRSIFPTGSLRYDDPKINY